jgi:hypothetical protein
MEDKSMVFKYKIGNLEVHEPPYTQEEQDKFYADYDRGMRSGQAGILMGHNVKAEPPTGTTAPKKSRRGQHKPDER